MRHSSMIAAAVLAASIANPASAACKNAAGQTVQCPPKPVAKATTQASAPKTDPKTCVIAGKAQPCKVKSHTTDATARLNYKW